MKMRSVSLFLSLIITSWAVANTYTHPDPAFKLEYDPKDWEVSRAKVENEDPSAPQKTLVALQKVKSQDSYHPRFSVVIEDVKQFEKAGQTPLQSYAQHARKFLESQNFGNLSSRNGKDILPKSQQEAVEMVGTQRNFGLTFRQVVVVKDGKAYLLTGACRTAEYQKGACGLDGLFTSFEFAS